MGQPAFGRGPDDGDPLHGQRGVDDGRDLSPGRDSLRRCSASSVSAAAAAPKARRAGSASSPARRPRSCSPPTSRGSNRLPRRTISAPAPGTPPSLCALMLTRSASSAARSSGTCPHAAAASTWTMTPASRHSATTSCTGCSVPTSWLPHWQCTSAGRGRELDRRRSRSASTSSRPVRVHGDVLGRRQARRRVAHRRVLHGGTEHGQARRGPGRTPDGGVDGLGRARGEDHLAPRHADQIRHLRAGDLERVADGAALFVQPAGVRGRQGGPLRQRGKCLGPRRGRAGVIEIGARHRGLRRTRCRRRRPAPARRGSPGAPGATPFRRARTAGP